MLDDDVEQESEIMAARNLGCTRHERGLDRLLYRLLGMEPDDRVVLLDVAG
jgi:hypothetical protein